MAQEREETETEPDVRNDPVPNEPGEDDPAVTEVDVEVSVSTPTEEN